MATLQHHERTIHIGTKQSCQDDALVRNKKLRTERSCLGIGTKREQISFWKWERAVLMFRMYLMVDH